MGQSKNEKAQIKKWYKLVMWVKAKVRIRKLSSGIN